MATSSSSLPAEDEFYAPPAMPGEAPDGEGAPEAASPARALIVPTIRRRNIPDLNLVAEDLRQLNLEGVSSEQIAAICSQYLAERERVNQDGFQAVPNGPKTFGLAAQVAFGIHSLAFGILAMRDPQWREAMRVHALYHASDDTVGEHGQEPRDEDEEGYDEFTTDEP